MATEASMRRRLLALGHDAVSVIGQSEQGRPILGAVMGRGPRRVSLMAGAHADEPVGTLTLCHLIESFAAYPEHPALGQFTFCMIPHVNPDGAAANAPWVERWPDLLVCLKQIVRELPGRDIEFGYPDGRVENIVASKFLTEYGPFALHASLHGMTLSEGGQLLIERAWVDRTSELRKAYGQVLEAAGLDLFAYDRQGEKGFEYLGPGFATTPRGEAMRAHFMKAGDASTAALFKDSSMEFVRSLGGDPLSLVTELPLFVMRGRPVPSAEGVPGSFLKLRAMLPGLRLKADRGEDVSGDLEPFELEPLAVNVVMTLQIQAIELGLGALGATR